MNNGHTFSQLQRCMEPVTYRHIVGFTDKVKRLVSMLEFSSREEANHFGDDQSKLLSLYNLIKEPYLGMVDVETFGVYEVPDSETFITIEEWSGGMIASVKAAPRLVPASAPAAPRLVPTPAAPAFVAAPAPAVAPARLGAPIQASPGPRLGAPTLRPEPAAVTLRREEAMKAGVVNAFDSMANMAPAMNASVGINMIITDSYDTFLGFFAPGTSRDAAAGWLSRTTQNAHEALVGLGEELDENPSISEYGDRHEVVDKLTPFFGAFFADVMYSKGEEEDLTLEDLYVRHVDEFQPICL